jgi:hypothetical protein
LAAGLITNFVAALEKPECYRDYHDWGNALENKGCSPPEQSDEDCNAWCKQSACTREGDDKNGWCKKIGNLHYCHCKC